ncbi:MAG: divalent-cation tolerance protein CutA [Candidatus Omnitrophica bacterium]|nr:divalent-cation tolerance protein CutA [Candidatus Omnitrophota bacterium]
MKGLVIFSMASSRKEAERIKNALLKKRCAACVNIIKDAKSFFWWKGKIDSAKETLLIVKTTGRNFKKCARLIRENHSYEVPEIIALPIVDGDTAYLKWLKNP